MNVVAPSVEQPQTERRRSAQFWIASAVFALAAVCYANAVHGQFVFDDIKLIVNNDIVKDSARAWDVVFTNLWGLLGRGSNYYRPLPPLLFMLLHALFGMRPEPFHLLNIVLHAGTSALVYLTARALLPAGGSHPRRADAAALGGAVWFAVHPLHTEAVAWISGVMDVSCAFFSLLALYLYATADAQRRRFVRTVLSMVALALALLSKEPAAVIPLAIVGFDLLFNRDRVATAGGALRRWMPAFSVLLGYLGLRAYVLGGVVPIDHAQGSPWLVAVLTVPGLFALYLQKLVLPVGLHVVYDIQPIASPASPAFLWALGVIVAFAVAGRYAWRAGGLACFGLLLFLLTLAPSLYVPALSQDLAKAFAERYAYLPSAGLALAAAASLQTAGRRRPHLYRLALGLVVVLAVVFSGMTLARNTVWRDSITLWSDCARKSPQLPVAHESLGLALITAGKATEGRQELQVALRLDPRLAESSLASGILAARKGLMLQAILSFQTALLYDPAFVEAHYNLAIAYEQMGWNSAAIEEYVATLAGDPAHADAHNNLGILYAQSYRIDDAIGHFEAAVRARPRDQELHLNLAKAYEAKGMAREAEDQRALAALAGNRAAR